MKARVALSSFTLAILAGIVGGAGTVYSPPAQALACANCATEWTQIMNNIQLVQQYAKQIEQYRAQLESLANEARNLASLPLSLVQQYQAIYQQYAQTVQQLRGVMNNVTALRDRFQQLYPDIANGSYTFEQLTAITRQWERSGRENIEDALAGGAQVLATMQGTASSLQQLGQASQSATGALQAMQAGNQINMMLGQELMKLNAQTAMFQQAILQEQARALGIEAKARANNQRVNSGWDQMRSTATPAARVGSQ